MEQFVAVAYTPHDEAARAAASQITLRLRRMQTWNLVAELTGAVVFRSGQSNVPTRVHVLPGHAGVVIGRLFRNAPEKTRADELESIDDSEATQVVATDGRYLLEHFWGYYVAFLRLSTRSEFKVIRDCSGKFPCYRVFHEGVHLFLSDPDIAPTLGVPPLSIDWQYLASFLLFDDMRVRRTGLREVTEILPGESLTIGSDVARPAVLWNPAQISASAIVDDFADACTALDHVARQCIDAWAMLHRDILLNLSGGFDSAVVLGCLLESSIRPRITCINRYTHEHSEDERGYARIAAESANVRLLEVEWSAGGVKLDERLLDVPRMARPGLDILTFAEVALRNELAQSLAVAAVWTGQGGDHLFLRRPTSLIVADYLHWHGLGARLTTSVADAARLADESYWSVLRSTIATRMKRRRWLPANARPTGTSFVRPDALPLRDAEFALHPWLEERGDIPPGKLEQIRDLADVVNQWSVFAPIEHAQEHHPLLSQPIIETCLRIPTYLLVAGGRKRSLARATFADIVPRQIVERESKGSTKAYTTAALRKGMPFVRELLLDGLLVREGVLDRTALEPHVVHGRPLHASQFYPMLACIAAEIWSRTWARRPVRAAAA